MRWRYEARFERNSCMFFAGNSAQWVLAFAYIQARLIPTLGQIYLVDKSLPEDRQLIAIHAGASYAKNT